MKVYAKQVDPENDSPANISGCSVYCIAWNDEGIRKEIADAEGIDPADVVFYMPLRDGAERHNIRR